MTDIETAGALYEAFEAHDGERLLGLLHDDFHGHVTPGMPQDWGGTHRGPMAMLRVWGGVASVLDTRPVPDELVETSDGRVIALGRYRGVARTGGREHDAVFAHVLEFRDGKIAALTQITDSARWHAALA